MGSIEVLYCRRYILSNACQRFWPGSGVPSNLRLYRITSDTQHLCIVLGLGRYKALLKLNLLHHKTFTRHPREQMRNLTKNKNKTLNKWMRTLLMNPMIHRLKCNALIMTKINPLLHPMKKCIMKIKFIKTVKMGTQMIKMIK